MPRIAQISISSGGVPKLPVHSVRVDHDGLEGDTQSDRRHHGGPDRAVCLFSLEVMHALQAEGHPIAPGSAGENLTIEGLDWPAVVPGARLRFDRGVELEITSYTVPCSTIRASFRDGAIKRIDQKYNPGSSRVYARITTPGDLQVGESLRLIPAC